MEMAFFSILAFLAVVAAAGVVISRNTVYSALFLLVNFCTLAGLYILLNAQFIAVVQVIVYAGAIVVLFLFVVMLLGVERGEGPDTKPYHRYLTIVLSLVLMVEVGYILMSGYLGGIPGPYTSEFIAREGNVQVIGHLLFKKYVLPFELASVLLLAAIIGAVFLAKRRM